MRLGWFTCSPQLAERFERIGETSTQSPCGLGQSLAMQLLRTWGMDGYLRWLRGIRAQYTARRDFFVDAISQTFELESKVCATGVWEGAEVFTAYARPRGGFMMREKARRVPLFEFVPPTAGMFVWVRTMISAPAVCCSFSFLLLNLLRRSRSTLRATRASCAVNRKMRTRRSRCSSGRFSRMRTC
jgi:hypothetical protein